MGQIVLVVDDSLDCLEIATLSLRLFGDFEVYQATDAETALAKARELKPNLILLDYHLGDTTGGQVIQSIRAFDDLTQIPIVVYSGAPKWQDKTPTARRTFKYWANP